jgi:hypothetical protein
MAAHTATGLGQTHTRLTHHEQTPPTPALRLCIIKPIGFAGLFRECNPCFSGHYRLFALKKANLLNDALVARMSWRGLPRIYNSEGRYRGRLSTNPYDPDSVSNPYGRYGNPYSPDSLNNPYGAGNPYSNQKHYVVPSQ